MNRFHCTLTALSLFALALPLHAEKRTQVEDSNSYGGETIELVFESGDSNFGFLEAARIYYDSEGNRVKLLSKLGNAKAAELGIAFQEETFVLGVRSEYRMYPTDEQKSIKGYDYIVERVDAQDNVIATTYGKNGKEVADDATSFMKSYPFYTVGYTKGRLFENDQPNEKGDAITFSAKFYRGRAFVAFSGPIEPMTAADTKIASYFFGSLGIKDGLQNYRTKTRVEENGKTYVIFLQDVLLPYIKAGNGALISYVDVGFNNEIYLLLTGLIDIR